MRAEIETDTLLKVVLVLAVAWLVLEILEVMFDTLEFVFTALPKLLGLAVIVLIVLSLADRL